MTNLYKARKGVKVCDSGTGDTSQRYTNGPGSPASNWATQVTMTSSGAGAVMRTEPPRTCLGLDLQPATCMVSVLPEPPAAERGEHRLPKSWEVRTGTHITYAGHSLRGKRQEIYKGDRTSVQRCLCESGLACPAAEPNLSPSLGCQFSSWVLPSRTVLKGT